MTFRALMHSKQFLMYGIRKTNMQKHSCIYLHVDIQHSQYCLLKNIFYTVCSFHHYKILIDHLYVDRFISGLLVLIHRYMWVLNCLGYFSCIIQYKTRKHCAFRYFFPLSLLCQKFLTILGWRCQGNNEAYFIRNGEPVYLTNHIYRRNQFMDKYKCPLMPSLNFNLDYVRLWRNTNSIVSY